jgi:hypothetical protein
VRHHQMHGPSPYLPLSVPEVGEDQDSSRQATAANSTACSVVDQAQDTKKKQVRANCASKASMRFKPHISAALKAFRRASSTGTSSDVSPSLALLCLLCLQKEYHLLFLVCAGYSKCQHDLSADPNQPVRKWLLGLPPAPVWCRRYQDAVRVEYRCQRAPQMTSYLVPKKHMVRCND